MLIVTGLLTLLALAHVEGDPIKGGFHAKGSSIAQEKVAQEEVIHSPFSTKTAAAYGTKVISQKTTDVVSKTAPEPSLHHATKTVGKTQPSPGVHHAATSPAVQEQIVVDPTFDSARGIKTLKTTTTENVRDPFALPVVQTVKSLADPTIQTKKGIMRDPIAQPVIQPIKTTKTRIIQEEVKMRDPVARPVIQTVKTSEDPSRGTKTVKTITKTTDASKFQSTKTSKISQDAVQYGIPESVVVASRNRLRTSAVDTPVTGLQKETAALLYQQSPQISSAERPSINTGSGIMNEFGEMILDEETLKTLRNAGGLAEESGYISLNDIGIKLLQSMRGENVLQQLPGSQNIAVSNQMRRPLATINTGDDILRKPESIASRSSSRTNEQIQRVRDQSRRRPSAVTPTRLNNSPGIDSGSRIATNDERLNPVPYTGRIEMNRIQTGSRMSTESGLRGSVETNALNARQDLKAKNPETVLFNGKEISVSGIQAGQLFDENLNPITPVNTQTDVLKSSVLPQAGKPVIAPVLTSTRNSGLTGMTRIRTAENRRRGSSQTVRRAQSTERVSGLNLNSQEISSTGGIKPALTAGTVLFNGKEIQVTSLREGQLFDENLQPIYPVNPSTGGAVVTNAAEIQRNVKPATNFGSRRVSSVSSNSGITETLTTSRGFGSRQGAQTPTSSDLRKRQRKPFLNTQQTSGQGLTRTKPVGISPGVVAITSGERLLQRIPNANTASRTASNLQLQNIRGDVTQISRQNIPGSNDVSDPNVLNLGGITSSGESGLTGTVFFDGKEINIDGVKPGQLFDENLSPIPMQNLGEIEEKIASIQSETPRGNAPFRNDLRTSSFISSQAIQSTGSRSSNLENSLRSTSEASRSSGVRLTENAPSVRTGSSVTGVPSSQTTSQALGGIRSSSNSLTSGSVLFNGKEISIDGLKSGQLFDENLRPILSGTQRSTAEKSATLAGVSPFSGTNSRGISQTYGFTSRQRTHTTNLRTPAQTTSAGGIPGISRTPVTGISQATQSQRLRSSTSGSLSRQRATQGTTTIRSGNSIASTAGTRSSSNSLTSGSVLFNGKEIKIDGLKPGQLFDENLQPITTGTSTANAEKSATLTGVSRISGLSGTRSSGISQTSGVRSTQRTQTTNLRTSAQIAPARGSSRTSQLRSSQRLRSSVSGDLSTQRASQGMAAIGTSGGSISSTSGIRSSSGSLTSGSVLFNGKEISIDGLQAGQLFDENLQPITTGTSTANAEKSATLTGVSRISGVSGTRSRGIAQTSGVRSTQRTQTTNLRTSAQIAPARESSRTSQLRSSQRLRSSVSGDLSTQGMAAIGTSGGSTTSTSGIRSSSGSLTSGSVLFNGKEISIDGLQAGQLFDENLQPITTGTSAANLEKSATLTGVSRISGVSGTRSRGISQTSGVRSTQRTQTTNLRTSAQIAPARGSSRTSQLRSSQRLRSSVSGDLSTQGMAAIGTSGGSISSTSGITSSSGSLTSGSVLFNGKEISIDGLQAGQLFDENLQPITTGTSTANAEKSATLTGVSRISGLSGTRSSGISQTSGVRSTQRTQTTNLRTSAQIAPARESSRTSQLRSSQRLRSSVSGDLSTQGMAAIGTSGGSTTSTSGIRSSSGSLTSGSVLFNGKEISIDGLQAGQLFDENLQPITTGTSTVNAEKSATLTGVSRISGLSGTRSSGISQTSGVRSTQRTQTTNLRTSAQIAPARESSRTSQLRSSQRLRSPVSGDLSTQRASQGMAAIGTSGGSTSSTSGIRSSSGSLTSGSVLFNGKEISIDGLQAGQLFDENLQPITTGTSTTYADKSATLTGVSRTSGIRSNTAAIVTGSTQAQRAQTNKLRSSSMTNSARVVTGTSRSSSTRLTQAAPSLGVGSLMNTVSSVRQPSQAGRATASLDSSLPSGSVLFNGNEIPIDGLKVGQVFDENFRPIQTGRLPEMVEKSPVLPGVSQRGSVTSSTGVGQSGGSLTSGSVLFNGKEIRIDELKPGQLFDENLQPINAGISGAVAEKSAALTDVSRTSEVRSDIASRVTGSATAQRDQANRLRFSSMANSARVVTGTSGTSSAGFSQSVPSSRVGPLSNSVSFVSTTSQGVPSATLNSPGGSLTSGSVLLNGQEISIDGLKAGQLFDENLRPIPTGTSGAPLNSIVRAPGAPSSQRTQISGLRSFESTSSRGISETSGSSGTRQSQSPSSLRSRPLPNSVSSAGRVSAAGVGMRSSAGSLTSDLGRLKPAVSGSSRGVTATSRITESRSQLTGNLRAGSLMTNMPSTQSTSLTTGGTRLTGTSNGAGSLSSVIPSASGNAEIIPAGDVLTSGTVLFNGKEIYMDGLKDGMIFDENLRPIISDAAVLRSISRNINSGSSPTGSIATTTNLRSGSSALNVLPVRYADITATSGASIREGIVSGLRSQDVPLQGSLTARNTPDIIDITRTDVSSIPTGILAADNSAGITGVISSQGGIASELSGNAVPFYTSGYGLRGTNTGSKLNQERINEGISAFQTGKPVVQEQVLFRTDSQQKIQEPVVEQSLITKPEALKSVQIQEPVSFTVSDTPKTFSRKITQISQKDIDIPSVQQKLLSDEFSGYLPKRSFLAPFNYAVPQHAVSAYNVKSPVIHQQQKIEQVFV